MIWKHDLWLTIYKLSFTFQFQGFSEKQRVKTLNSVADNGIQFLLMRDLTFQGCWGYFPFELVFWDEEVC